MSSVRLPDFPRPLPELEADAAAVEDVGADLLAASSQVDDAGSVAAGEGRVPGWEGGAAVAYRAALRPWGDRVDAMSLALRGVARRVDEHAEQLARMLVEREDLVAAGATLDRDVLGLEADARAWWERASAAAPGDGDALALEQERLALQARSDALAERVARHDRRGLAWWSRVGVEERAMVAALDRVLGLDQVVRRYGGVEDPADDALAGLPAGAGPGAVHRWWSALTRAERTAILAAAPGAVGALDGIPARARDAANRNALRRDLGDWRRLRERGTLTPAEQQMLELAEATEEALGQHDGEVDPDGVPVPSMLWLYDPDAFPQGDGTLDGRVAVAIGDPDTADHVAVNVPGIGTEGADVGSVTDRAWRLHQSATVADPSSTYASIGWIGYDAPAGETWPDRITGGAAGEGRAHAGGHLLADALDGLRASRDTPVDLVPIGHSYGSTTLGSALHDHDLGLDRVAVVGSPGLTGAVHGVEDLHLPPDGLHVGRNHDDPVARLGTNGALGLGLLGGAGLGHDPADAGFGGARFGANAAGGDDDHGSYYAEDSESLHNLGRIVAGLDPTYAAPVHDPWWGPARDPEQGSAPGSYDTGGG